jgi:hypothetical protein
MEELKEVFVEMPQRGAVKTRKRQKNLSWCLVRKCGLEK